MQKTASLRGKLQLVIEEINSIGGCLNETKKKDHRITGELC